MPSQRAHIVYADNFLKANPSRWDRVEFIIGSVWPDIRYLGTLSREQTHVKDADLNELSKVVSSFEAGVEFHSYLDCRHKQIIGQKVLSTSHPDALLRLLALKLLEDEILYSKMDDWRRVANYFDRILPQELERGVSEVETRRWHALLQRYFTKGPVIDPQDMMLELGFDQVEETMADLSEIRNQPNIYKELADFYSEVVSNFSQKMMGKT